MKIYPPYGTSPDEGHTLGYFGSSVWAEDVFSNSSVALWRLNFDNADRHRRTIL